MCLIAIKPKGKYAYSEFFIEGLITSSKTNKDGIGFAYKRKGEQGVHYEKGMTEIRPFIDKLRALEIKDEDELIIHLRRTSSGEKSILNCHPFLMTSIDGHIDDPGPAKTYNNVLFHNGHLKSFADLDDKHSDTYMLVKTFFRNRDVVEMLYKDKLLFTQCFGDLIKPERNRIAILSNSLDKDIITIGGFIEDQGYLFSNITYKDSKIIDTGGSQSKIPNSPIKGFSLGSKFDEIDNINQRVYNLLGNAEVPSIIPNANNFFELIFIANKDMEIGIQKDSKWVITKWTDDAKTSQYQQLLINFDNPSIFSWIDLISLRGEFKAVPRLAYQLKYKDYYRISQLIKPTKSAVKKVHDKINAIASRRGRWPENDDIIDIKYKNRPFSLRYDAICMFIRDNITFLNGYANIPTLKPDVVLTPNVDKNTEVVEKLREFREVKKKAEETTKSKDEAISEDIKKNEEITQKNLEEFKEKNQKQLEKVDSNNGEDNPQEKRELTLAEQGLSRCN